MSNQVAVAARRPSRRQIGRVLWQNKTLILMCLPAIAFFFIFCYMPMPGMYIAFVKYNYSLGIFNSPFVGLKNFTFLFTSGQLLLLLAIQFCTIWLLSLSVTCCRCSLRSY